MTDVSFVLTFIYMYASLSVWVFSLSLSLLNLTMRDPLCCLWLLDMVFIPLFTRLMLDPGEQWCLSPVLEAKYK